MISGYSAGHNSTSYIILQVQTVIFYDVVDVCLLSSEESVTYKIKNLETQVMRFDVMVRKEINFRAIVGDCGRN